MSGSTDLRNELQHSVGEERPDGQADEVGQHLGEVGLLRKGDEEEAKQCRQVDQSDCQEAVAPHCGAVDRKWAVSMLTGHATVNSTHDTIRFTI